MRKLSKQYLQQLRGEYLIQWNIIGSKIELIDFLLADDEPPTVDEVLDQLGLEKAE